MSLDEIEIARLEEAIVAAQRIQGVGGASSDATGIPVARFISEAERRIEALETTHGDYAQEQKRDVERSISLVAEYLADRETALSASEREQFAGFLKQDHFTKANFDELDEFYGSAYDRLSERGKAEMSFRVWEGVRRGEYVFSELPENTKDKEMERLYGLLTDPEKMPENLKRIPESDREEFVAAIESGEKEKAAKLLDKEEFSENVSTKEELESARQHGQSDERDSQNNLEREQNEVRNGSRPATELAHLGKSELSLAKV